MKGEKVKTFNKYGVTLNIFDLNKRALGKWNLGYQLRVKRQTIFEGEDFCASPMNSIDSIETVKDLLGFLTLQYGDTDRDYFDNYTEAQKTFMYSDECENLRLWLYS